MAGRIAVWKPKGLGFSKLEVAPKHHFRPNRPPASPALGHEPFGCELMAERLVAGLFKMLTYYRVCCAFSLVPP